MVNEEDFQQILEKEVIHDVLLMTNLPQLKDVALLLQDWQGLAYHLKLDEPTIKQIQEDNRDKINQQKYQCLYKLVQLNGKDATLLALLRIMYFRFKDKLLIHQIAQCQCGMLTTHMISYRAIFDGENIDGQHLRPPVSAILLETIERENFDG